MNTPDRTEAELVAEQVNRHPTGATDPGEEAILERLYGPPDAEGIYRGEPQP
ncbi:hypothetical protein ACQEVF_59585 [Nonomuraea polychroma]|uniref:hypothetical protein n=1 Tax=Nonomuraea polychroma TaxID=46176 RepID=UPI003D917A01